MVTTPTSRKNEQYPPKELAMTTPKSTGLSGMKAIAAYWGRSQATVLKLIQTQGFPAAKIAGNWESDTVLIDEYRRKRVRLEVERTARSRAATAAPAPAPKKKPSRQKIDRGW